MLKRALDSIVFDPEWGRQMRFIAGPRQCGKTTLAKEFLVTKCSSDFYFNWDDKSLRVRYSKNSDLFYEEILSSGIKAPWICFDEIHKVKNWKNILKSHFDNYENKIQTIVTGSARLDLFRRSGDSLAGRYFLFNLHPLMLSELDGSFDIGDATLSADDFIEKRMARELDWDCRRGLMDDLLSYSGFPEPFIKASPKFHAKWQSSYTEKLIYEDLRDLSGIKNLDATMEFLHLLPGAVGSPLSINSFVKLLQLNHETIKNYLKYLELAYMIFELKPYSKNLRHMVHKEKKIYFSDWTRVEDEAARFENYIASELQSLTSLWTASGLVKAELYYLRANNGQETDFLITKNKKPWLMVEVKLSSDSIDRHHYNFARNLGSVPILQITKSKKAPIIKSNNAYVLSAERFL